VLSSLESWVLGHGVPRDPIPVLDERIMRAWQSTGSPFGNRRLPGRREQLLSFSYSRRALGSVLPNGLRLAIRSQTFCSILHILLKLGALSIVFSYPLRDGC